MADLRQWRCYANRDIDRGGVGDGGRQCWGSRTRATAATVMTTFDIDGEWRRRRWQCSEDRGNDGGSVGDGNNDCVGGGQLQQRGGEAVAGRSMNNIFVIFLLEPLPPNLAKKNTSLVAHLGHKRP
jgi:hypothetical protein